MAMFAGLQGVRSAVASQVAAHIFAPTMTDLKAGLHLPTVLKSLGTKSLTAYVDTHSNWREKLFDAALRLYPVPQEERCNNPVCPRISFMYAPLYCHAQLNTATHDALHEMFGVANIRTFEHLSLLVRTGHLVDAQGKESYLAHPERLRIPIAFIHGEQNQCFLPESTAATFNFLREKNGNQLYTRQVIPNYGHIDCIYGKNAVQDVYPYILSHLEKTCLEN